MVAGYAIHAAISGTEAAAIALAGVRSTDPDHQRAGDLLDEVAAADPGFDLTTERICLIEAQPWLPAPALAIPEAAGLTGVAQGAGADI
jgi:hypothetical protein